MECSYHRGIVLLSQIIGRVSQLTMLNGADIKPRDRRDAEVRYLQNIVTDLAELDTAEMKEQFEAQHPRFQVLKQKYGALLIGTGARGAQQGSALTSSMVAVALMQVRHKLVREHGRRRFAHL